MLLGSIWKRMRFFRSESGSATVEAVLWLPVFFAFIIVIADASLIFFGQNQAHRLVQDANRQLSIGRLQDADEVEAYLTASLATLAPNATVASEIDIGVISSTVSIPASDLVAVGLITALSDATIYVAASHYVEY